MYGIAVAGIEAIASTLLNEGRPISRAEAMELVVPVLSEFRHFNVSPEDVILTGRDSLFRFNLRVKFFNGLGKIEFSASQMDINFRDMSTATDVEMVSSIIVAANSLLKGRAPHATCALTVNFHAHLREGGTTNSYFESLVPPINGIHPAGLAFYQQSPPFLREVRAAIERSNSLPNGVFFNWNGVAEGVVSLETISQMKKSIYSFLPIMNLKPAEGTVVL